MAALDMGSDLEAIKEATSSGDATWPGFVGDSTGTGTDELSALAGKRLGHIPDFVAIPDVPPFHATFPDSMFSVDVDTHDYL